MKALLWLKKVWLYLSPIKLLWWYEIQMFVLVPYTFFPVIFTSALLKICALLLKIVDLCFRYGSVPNWKSMLNSLGQMEFERVLCHILRGNTCHKHLVLLVWIHFVITWYIIISTLHVLGMNYEAQTLDT
jgi:hypothetical protein